VETDHTPATADTDHRTASAAEALQDAPVAVLYDAPHPAAGPAAAPDVVTKTATTPAAEAPSLGTKAAQPADAEELDDGTDPTPDKDEAAPAPSPPAHTPSAPFTDAEDAALARAQSYARKGQHLFALNVYRKLGQTHDTDPRVLRGWSEAAVKTKGWGEALRVAIRWANTDSGSEAQLYLARIQRAAGQRYGAVATLTRLIEAHPGAPDEREAREMLDKIGGERKLASR
jgi:tetratricopeptide (TPR) repeat protein